MKLKVTSIENSTVNTLLKSVIFGCLIFSLFVMSGCAAFGPMNDSTSTPPETTTPPSETENTPTPSTPTITPEDNNTINRSIEQKYSHFREGYINSLEGKNVSVNKTSIDPGNKTLYITYDMHNPGDDEYVGWERENISLLYVVGTETYLNETATPSIDESWIPKQVNVTAVTPEGVRYETAYTTFERAKEMIDGEITAKRYLLEYYGTIEPGPANPEYEG